MSTSGNARRLTVRNCFAGEFPGNSMKQQVPEWVLPELLGELEVHTWSSSSGSGEEAYI